MKHEMMQDIDNNSKKKSRKNALLFIVNYYIPIYDEIRQDIAMS